MSDSRKNRTCITLALEEAQLRPEDIQLREPAWDFTEMNDRVETRALK